MVTAVGALAARLGDGEVVVGAVGLTGAVRGAALV
jgi:hypothetical protein